LWEHWLPIIKYLFLWNNYECLIWIFKSDSDRAQIYSAQQFATFFLIALLALCSCKLCLHAVYEKKTFFSELKPYFYPCTGSWRLELYFLPSLSASSPLSTSTLPLLHLAWHLLAIAVLATIASTFWPSSTLRIQLHNSAADSVTERPPRKRPASKLAKTAGTEYSLKIERRQLTGGGGGSASSTAAESEAASECSLAVSEPTAAVQESDDNEQRISPLEEFNTLYRNRDLVRASIKLKESNLV
jgi:hypothetical protein